ncbi:nitroreductase family protein [Oenococcus kitaharae]|uniref:Nitroreductase family protein n=1 Tax=Oenococcus kitaharae DSM 17330 TaxID=1045004 RepID=G9WGI0_9LACO|nr:nitroreductase family protein [Oenococcus kitaharae]EHN59807.1 Nitroreductase family protein [Oenococcus kitaharae DSM 17330]OEY83623.1 nitroreductase [Oenococcus kitaharae]OEY85421.1 nitroreductase [Oenococcus kitaharae]OEY86274.1 nitroreductase [Oenococcus kitaharae]
MIDHSYLELLKSRRSIRTIGKNVDYSKEEITDLVEQVIKESPTAFNNQTVRSIILFGKSSDLVWEIIAERLKAEVPSPEAYDRTKAKIDSFEAGFGTILYFSDRPTIEKDMAQFALYKDNFCDWSEQGLGGAEINVWTALANVGLGANLQHYNPLIDDQIKQAFQVPDGWVLRAQMPFGSIEGPADDKDYLADDLRFKVRYN